MRSHLKSRYVLGPMIAVLACASPSGDRAAPVAGTPWTLQSRRPQDYTVTAQGQGVDSAGAALTLTAPATPRAGAVGRVWATLAPRGGGAHRVLLSAELRPKDVVQRATIWMDADSAGRTVAWSRSLAAAQGTSTWVRQEIHLVAPAGTRTVRYGVMLEGGGSVEVRGLRIRATPIPAPGTPLAPAAADELESALAFARTHAAARDPGRWTVLEREARAAAAGARTPADVHPAIRRLVNGLGDRHAYFMSPLDMARFADRQDAVEAGWVVRALGTGIGYLEIPGYMSADTIAGTALATRVLAEMAQIAPAASCGWVVDLRRNGGGTYPPMFAVAGPLLGRGPLGAFVPDGAPPGTLPQRAHGPSADGADAFAEASDDAVWRVGGPVDPPVPAELAALERLPVAVLTGPQTGSAGEIMTIAFRARPATRSFGAATAGLTSAGAGHVLPSGAVLSLSTGWYADRTGRQYRGPVAPEVVVEGAAASRPADRVLEAAVGWLRGQAGCAG